MRSFGLLTETLTAAAVLAYAPPAASWGPGDNDRDGGSCSPDASLLGFTDALDKSSYEGTQVSGLSALAGTRHNRALALVDNVGTTPARFYDVRIGTWWGLDADIRDVTTLTRPDGTPYTGADFDGEGLVVERGGRTILASPETEPSIRRFSRSDGRQIGELEVPERFGVAPDGEAAVNATFESLTVTRSGRTLYAGMEGPPPTTSPARLWGTQLSPTEVDGVTAFRRPAHPAAGEGRAESSELSNQSKHESVGEASVAELVDGAGHVEIPARDVEQHGPERPEWPIMAGVGVGGVYQRGGTDGRQCKSNRSTILVWAR